MDEKVPTPISRKSRAEIRAVSQSKSPIVENRSPPPVSITDLDKGSFAHTTNEPVDFGGEMDLTGCIIDEDLSRIMLNSCATNISTLAN